MDWITIVLSSQFVFFCVFRHVDAGTSACPAAKFYCRNVGSTPKFIYSSQVNDQVCDCCDGSDEYGSEFNCPNTCFIGGSMEYKAGSYLSYLDAKRKNDAKANDLKKASLEELLNKVTGLKMIILLQALLVAAVVIFKIFKRRVKSKRRHHHR